ncbi:MAG: 8-oxo-dGTP diphosphatase [Phycisphaerales bacterium]|jgi:8-oxo-dGTP diphosphatase|nr:8-oxo-dGTP diphosphatase [Phycisphaerales bacterium]
MRTYVCGFLFSPDRTRVLLIRKRRPAWQAGKLNGVGGKIEPGESPLQAMRREFREEAQLDLADWQEILTLSGPDDAGSGVAWRGHFFRAFGDIDAARSMTDEQLERHAVRALPLDTIPNLHWIIPLMLDEEPIRGAYVIELVR